MTGCVLRFIFKGHAEMCFQTRRGGRSQLGSAEYSQAGKPPLIYLNAIQSEYNYALAVVLFRHSNYVLKALKIRHDSERP